MRDDVDGVGCVAAPSARVWEADPRSPREVAPAVGPGVPRTMFSFVIFVWPRVVHVVDVRPHGRVAHKVAERSGIGGSFFGGSGLCAAARALPSPVTGPSVSWRRARGAAQWPTPTGARPIRIRERPSRADARRRRCLPSAFVSAHPHGP